MSSFPAELKKFSYTTGLLAVNSLTKNASILDGVVVVEHYNSFLSDSDKSLSIGAY